jgi:hypothetical protein
MSWAYHGLRDIRVGDATRIEKRRTGGNGENEEEKIGFFSVSSGFFDAPFFDPGSSPTSAASHPWADVNAWNIATSTS